MLAEQRRLKILELLQEDGSARVSNLSKTFDVSEPTIRQDLEKLETEGHIVRQHGGAFLKDVPQQVQNLALHHQENMDKKLRIGKKAAEFINDWDSIILDSGSSITEVAQNIANKQNLTIITNALNIALLLGSQPSFEIMVTGGEFKAPTLSLTGEKAANFFRQFHVNKLFLATRGISLETGLTYPSVSDLPVKKAMIESATEVFLVADSTKIGNPSFASLGRLDMIHYFITDDQIRDEDRKIFENKGIKVVIA